MKKLPYQPRPTAAALANLSAPARDDVNRWLTVVEIVIGRSAGGIGKAVASVAVENGVTPRALAERFRGYRKRGWKAMIRGRHGRHAGLQIAVPTADQPEFQRLPGVCQMHVLQWQSIVNDVQPTKEGVQAALAATAYAHHQSFARVRNWYYAAKAKGWRGLLTRHLHSHDGMGITVPPYDAPHFLTLPVALQAHVNFWLPLVNAVVPQGRGIRAALQGTAVAHGVTYGRLRNWYYAALKDGWRGLLCNLPEGAQSLAVAVLPQDAHAFAELPDFAREAVTFRLQAVNSVDLSKTDRKAAFAAHAITCGRLRDWYYAARSHGWRGLVPKYRRLDAAAKDHRTVRLAFSASIQHRARIRATAAIRQRKPCGELRLRGGSKGGA